MEQRKHVDFVSSLVFMAISIYMIVEGFRYHADITQRQDLPFYGSPGFFPVVIGGGMLICSILLFIRSIKGGAFKENIQKIAAGAKALANKETLYTIGGIGIMALYVFVALPMLGYVIGSLLFLVGIMLYLKAGHIVKILLVSGAVIGISFFVVQVIFRAPLP